MNNLESQQAVAAMWESYPPNYRQNEIRQILSAVRSGDCVEVIGPSGSGKSNLLGFLANRPELFPGRPRFVLVDCNRLAGLDAQAVYQLLLDALEQDDTAQPAQQAMSLKDVQSEVGKVVAVAGSLCLLIDRFELMLQSGESILGNLRALRDAFKYQLTYVIAMRRPMAAENELAELFFGRSLWLGVLSESDARWNIGRCAERLEQQWGPNEAETILRLSGGYPALLRAVCDALAGGTPLDVDALRSHPAVQRRVDEFWADGPTRAELRRTGLEGVALLERGEADRAAKLAIDAARLTAKEYLLLQYLQAHAGQVCDKDAIIQAVWPEDKIFSEGVRDESLAQLVRRLRKKIEIDADNPTLIQTVSNRGYLYRSPA